MQFQGVTFTGPAVDDPDTFERLPSDLNQFLAEVNGVVAYEGGLHIRGACSKPDWHSLATAWNGPNAFHVRYPAIEPGDIPFAQDAVGDQWLLRGDRVIRLLAETGDVEGAHSSFDGFLAAVERDSIETLGLHPLMQFIREGGRLQPGELLSVYPPFCTEESASGVSLRAISADERLGFLADLARQLSAGSSRQERLE